LLCGSSTCSSAVLDAVVVALGQGLGGLGALRRAVLVAVDERQALLLGLVLLEEDLEVGVGLLALLGQQLQDLVLERVVLHHLLVEVAALAQVRQLAHAADLVEHLRPRHLAVHAQRLHHQLVVVPQLGVVLVAGRAAERVVEGVLVVVLDEAVVLAVDGGAGRLRGAFYFHHFTGVVLSKVGRTGVFRLGSARPLRCVCSLDKSCLSVERLLIMNQVIWLCVCAACLTVASAGR